MGTLLQKILAVMTQDEIDNYRAPADREMPPPPIRRGSSFRTAALLIAKCRPADPPWYNTNNSCAAPGEQVLVLSYHRCTSPVGGARTPYPPVCLLALSLMRMAFPFML